MPTSEIALPSGDVALVDHEDWLRLKDMSWFKTTQGYVVHEWRKDGKRGVAYLHHLLWPPPGYVIDHINGNKLDNRKENLRICLRRENSWNNSRKVGQSGLRGAHWHKGKKKWTSTIGVNGKLIHLGHFKTKEDASRAWYAAAKKLHNGYAKEENQKD